MAQISAVTHIDATPQEVWDVATDLDRMGEWVSIHEGFPDPPPGELTAGSRFKQDLKVARVGFQVEWTATEVEPAARLTWDGTGPAGTAAHTSYTLAPEDGGTRFAYENEFTLPAGGVGKVAGRAVQGQAERQLKKSLKALKELVEG